MPDLLRDFWDGLPAVAQDVSLCLLLLLPGLLTGLLVLRGYRVRGLLGALLRRYLWTNAVFVALIAVSVALGVGLTAQERGLRRGTAAAADKFDLIVAAPGSEITAMLAAVYLQPSDIPLLDGDAYAEIAGTEGVALAAPIAFGDSYRGAPVVGTTPAFVAHMAGERLEGRAFASTQEAVAGRLAGVPLGAEFTPAHGIGDAVEEEAHDAHYTVTGLLPETGTPWDRAILVPVEGVWAVHGLDNGHGPDWDGRVGPPFRADHFPGTPAVLVRADQLWANYALQSRFQTAETMAFFPGAVLARLYSLLGDVRQAMSVMAGVTQVLVTGAVLAGLVLLLRLFARRLALLRALGAPARFVFAVVWGYAAALIATGAALGMVLGLGAAVAISRVVTARTDIAIPAALGWPELQLVAGFVSLTLILALLPAIGALRRPLTRDLRG